MFFSLCISFLFGMVILYMGDTIKTCQIWTISSQILHCIKRRVVILLLNTISREHILCLTNLYLKQVDFRTDMWCPPFLSPIFIIGPNISLWTCCEPLEADILVNVIRKRNYSVGRSIYCWDRMKMKRVWANPISKADFKWICES